MNIFIRNGNRKRFFFQSLPMAGFTRRDPHKCLIFLLRHIRPCLTITTLHVADQPLKCYVVNTDTTLEASRVSRSNFWANILSSAAGGVLAAMTVTSATALSTRRA